MLRYFVIVILGFTIYGILNQHAQEWKRFEQHLQVELNKRAAAELALEVANYRTEHGTLPTTIERTTTPSYGATDPYAFGDFRAKWPGIVLEDGIHFDPDSSDYGGPGFLIDRYVYAPDGHVHLAYWKHGPRNRDGK